METKNTQLDLLRKELTTKEKQIKELEKEIFKIVYKNCPYRKKSFGKVICLHHYDEHTRIVYFCKVINCPRIGG